MQGLSIMLLQAQQNFHVNSNSFGFRDYASLILALVGLFTLIFGLMQYRKGLLQKRSEQFLKMRERYVDNPEFQELFELIETDNEKLKDIPYKKKLKFLGFYEELALMRNSKLIKKEVAYYMFAYHAIRIWKSKNFWYFNNISNPIKSVNKDSQYWILFKIFATEMCNYEKYFSYLLEKDESKFLKKVKFKL